MCNAYLKKAKYIIIFDSANKQIVKGEMCFCENHTILSSYNYL